MLANKVGFIKRRAWQYIHSVDLPQQSFNHACSGSLPALDPVFGDIIVTPPALQGMRNGLYPHSPQMALI
jgi:hypothetical protein